MSKFTLVKLDASKIDVDLQSISRVTEISSGDMNGLSSFTVEYKSGGYDLIKGMQANTAYQRLRLIDALDKFLENGKNKAVNPVDAAFVITSEDLPFTKIGASIFAICLLSIACLVAFGFGFLFFGATKGGA